MPKSTVGSATHVHASTARGPLPFHNRQAPPTANAAVGLQRVSINDIMCPMHTPITSSFAEPQGPRDAHGCVHLIFKER